MPRSQQPLPVSARGAVFQVKAAGEDRGPEARSRLAAAGRLGTVHVADGPVAVMRWTTFQRRVVERSSRLARLFTDRARANRLTQLHAASNRRGRTVRGLSAGDDIVYSDRVATGRAVSPCARVLGPRAEGLSDPAFVLRE